VNRPLHIDFERTISLLRQWSLPLILGIVAGLIVANLHPDFYHHSLNFPLFPAWFGPHFTPHFLINDIFMVFFFGMATKEITESFLPGGALSNWRHAVNPLMATVGGVLGAAGCFLLLNVLAGQPAWTCGWGIPTATDIALAWLVGRFIFGRDHPALSFLLLLAVADDAIGLGIIAIAYPDPHHAVEPWQLIWVVAGICCAGLLRLGRVDHWLPYIMLGGVLSWWGFHSAHLHPALALVPIVPFLPAGRRDWGLFREPVQQPNSWFTKQLSPLEAFQKCIKPPVEFGLFFFAFANAGVPLQHTTGLTWLILISLFAGKTIGVVSLSAIGKLLGFPLPQGMGFRHLWVAGMIAGIGLTVALFVSKEAYADPSLQSAAKMGALLSVGAILPAWICGRLFKVREIADS
jgi:NhaA family Na+:H+ antiporter